MSIQELRTIPFSNLMEAFPEGRMLMRDSGRWLIYEDDSQDADCLDEQDDGQSFEEFIINFIAVQLELEKPDDQGYLHLAVDVAIAAAQKSLLEDQTWNTPIEGEINL